MYGGSDIFRNAPQSTFNFSYRGAESLVVSKGVRQYTQGKLQPTD